MDSVSKLDQQSNQASAPVNSPMDRNGLPPELKGFNWGAFVFTWIWGIGNRVWISLVFLMPLLLVLYIICSYRLGLPEPPRVFEYAMSIFLMPWFIIIATLVFGFMGNRLAWKAKDWDSVGHFKSVQRKWKIAGIICFVPVILFLLGLASALQSG